MKRKIYLFLAWLHDYFKHPLPNARNADYIKPNTLYRNFGNICVCVRRTAAEENHLRRWPDMALPVPLLLQALHSAHPMSELDAIYARLFNIIEAPDIPSHCNFCDFYIHGIPCPLHNHFANGVEVCNTHKYIIIKRA